MAREQVVTSLDIGNSKIRVVVGVLSPEKKEPHIVGIGISPSLGLRKGAVIDVDELVSNIAAALEDAERMSGIPVHHLFVGLSGHHIDSATSKGIVAIAQKEVTESDIRRVLEAAQNAALLKNEHILRIIPKSFTLDEQKDVKNPLGMSGIRLEVDAHVVTGSASVIKNIEKCVHQSGVDIDDIIPSPLASAEAVLSKRQKELGVVSIDIGCDTTSVVVYEEGSVLHSVVVPIGGASVTNDIAIGLRSSIDAAEKMKIEFGTNLADEVSENEEIDLSTISKIDSHTVSRKHLAEIIQARYFEIFSFVKAELRKVGRDGMLPAGAILSGAAIKMPGTLELAREALEIPVQIGFPQDIQGMIDKIDDPSYATAIGLILWGIRHNTPQRYGFSFGLGGLFSGIGSLFKKLLP
ncbi:MAG: cell division protein FtsA [Candidatus Peregrinibacteria bacterium]